MTRAALLAAHLLCAAGAGGVAACSRPTPITTCDDPLGGVWRSDADRRWMILERSATLEIYPLFEDAHPDGDPTIDPTIVVAPRVIDLGRSGDAVRGVVHRRYMRGADRCDAQAPVRLTACAAGQLELVLSDPLPPLAYAPCVWPRPSGSRRERWRRE